MSKSADTVVSTIIHSIGLKNNLVDSRVKEIVEAQFRFAYEKMRKLDLTGVDQEEIEQMKTNIYFKYIGKLYVEADKVVTRNLKTLVKKENDGRQEDIS